MTISKPIKVALIVLAVCIALAAMILGIIWRCLISGYDPGEQNIAYDSLQVVMGDDVVYLSDDFISDYDFEKQSYPREGEEVWLLYNKRKVVIDADFSQRVENVESYYYKLKSKDSAQISAAVSVHASVKKYKDYKYDRSYGGYAYAAEEDFANRAATYIIKTTPKKRATCILTVEISLDRDDTALTQEKTQERIEQIFKSAVENIVTYGQGKN